MGQEQEEPTIIRIKTGGRVDLPEWVWKQLCKQVGLRSKKQRQIKKTVKKEFQKALLTMLINNEGLVR